MKGLVRSAVAAALTLSGSALANPIMVVSEVYVEQFPGTTHVQVTRTYSTGASSTTAVTRDGATVAVTFESRSGGSRDLGSGMSNLTTVAGCDCSVPVGHHSYVVAGTTVPLDVRDASATSGTPRAPSAQCDVKCESGVPAGGAGGTSSSTSGAGVGNTSSSTGGVGAGGTSSSTGGVGAGGTLSATGGVGIGGTSSSTGGASVGGATPSTGGIGTGGTAPSTSTTTATTGNVPSSATGGAPSKSTTSTASNKNDSGESSGCAIARTTTGLLPLGILAALGLLAFRRRK